MDIHMNFSCVFSVHLTINAFINKLQTNGYKLIVGSNQSANYAPSKLSSNDPTSFAYKMLLF